MLDVAEKLMKCGALELDPETRVLSGPRGQVRLASQPFSIVERLMRRQGVIVSFSDLISSVWPDADNEPEYAHGMIRDAISDLRGFMCLVGADPVRIMSERNVGYFIGKRR
ncbi:MAG: helix-turn-helix domain-containing protein [Gluconobacter cerinus]|uniref:winged helix-turn-helix domain-containing protein n=2 Tax=Gluconobacter cerinus TaxID=38307 RepID=UPI0039E7FA52